MRKDFLLFGKITIPVSKKHKQTGVYTSIPSKKIMTNIQVSFYPPALGNPLYKEAPSKSYKSKVPHARQST